MKKCKQKKQKKGWKGNNNDKNQAKKIQQKRRGKGSVVLFNDISTLVEG